MTITAQQPLETPRPHRFTRDEYYRLGELGFFQDRRVELIQGEIIDMAPQKNPHVLTISLVAEALRAAFGPDYWIRSQAPLHFRNNSEPEPDVAVVKGPMKSYTDHPTSALLVVEVSDTTLQFDLGKKANLYAQAGIKDYWIVNLQKHCLLVLRKPVEDPQSPFGWRYDSIEPANPGESISPLEKPTSIIKVADLLP